MLAQLNLHILIQILSCTVYPTLRENYDQIFELACDLERGCTEELLKEKLARLT